MKMKEIFSSDHVPGADPLTKPGMPPSPRQMYQSRFNHGPNLGAMFVLEKWIFDGLFANSSGGSELDAVSATVAKEGIDVARQKFEQHWRSYMNDQDWEWLQSKGVTGVRAPIGYWDVDNGRFTKDTPFEKYAGVYSHAWDLYKTLVIDRANQFGISVLVDLHGLPGGANEQEHSGTSSGKAALWSSSKYRHIALDVLEFMASDLKSKDNVNGIQVLNEAPYASNTKDQEKFYLRAISRIRSENSDVPIVISDGWKLNAFARFVHEQDAKVGKYGSVGTIIDTHVYKCFSDADKQKTPSQLINDVDSAVPESNDVDIIVGEYSCVLDGESYKREQINRDDVVMRYGRKQNEHFYRRARAGAYFWTYKFEHGSGGEWDFREMVDKQCIPVFPTSVPKSFEDSQQVFQHVSTQAVSQHHNHWVQQDSKRDWEVWRFEAGFKTGWDDARAFDEFNRSEIGRLKSWARSRLGEHVNEKGNSDLTWTWTHGFMQGVDRYAEFSRS